jgi:hypothetical protein
VIKKKKRLGDRKHNSLDKNHITSQTMGDSPPSRKGGHTALLLSVAPSVGPPAVFRSFSSHWLHILKWNLIHRFIMRISRSSSLLGTIEPFLTELWPLDFEKFHEFAVSVHFLCTGCTYWNEIWYKIYHNNI